MTKRDASMLVGIPLTHVGAVCPWGCGYVFDNGFVAVAELTRDLLGVEWSGLGICSRCKRAIGLVANGGLMKLENEASLPKEARLSLALTRQVTRETERRGHTY